MSQIAEETARLADVLPDEKARALLDYARYLAERADEDEWERRFNDPKYSAKLQAMMAKVDEEIAAGKTEPLDLSRL